MLRSRSLRLRGRPLRAIIASLLALANAGFGLYNCVTWPLAALVGGRAWEVGGLGPALLLTLALLGGALLLGAGGLLLLSGYYRMAARFLLGGGLLGAYGNPALVLGLAVVAAVLGGTVPEEDASDYYMAPEPVVLPTDEPAPVETSRPNQTH